MSFMMVDTLSERNRHPGRILFGRVDFRRHDFLVFVIFTQTEESRRNRDKIQRRDRGITRSVEQISFKVFNVTIPLLGV